MIAKIHHFGSNLALIGAGILLASSCITTVCWLNDEDPDQITKTSLIGSIVLLTTGTLLSGITSKEKPDSGDLNADHIWNHFKEIRALREASPCPNCRHLGQYCAMNPHVACTPEANNCSDFESKEN